MMRSLYAGVSGLKVHQTRMDVIGNNIANINTIGFKGSRTTFSDMLSQLQRNSSAPTNNLGGINPRQIGLGAAVESIDLLFTDTSPQQTGKNTDLALSGNGLFVLKNGNQTFYTRNGAFEFDEAGNFVLPGSGLRVQGWNATTEGVLNTNALAEDVVVPVGKTMEAEATTMATYSGNLNKEALVITSISYSVAAGVDRNAVIGTANADNDNPPKLVTAVDEDGAALATVDEDDDFNVTSVNVDGETVLSATVTLSNGQRMTFTNGYYEVGHSVPITTIATVYDSLGGKHEITVLIDKSPATAAELGDNAPAEGTLAYETGKVVPVLDENGNPTDETTRAYYNLWRVYLAPGQGKLGPAAESFANELTVTAEDGSTATAKMNLSTSDTGDETTATSYIFFDDTGKFVTAGTLADTTLSPTIAMTYADGNGAAAGNIDVDLTGLSQYANNTTSFPTTNGYTSGVLKSVAIDGSGIISGTYTNGQIRTEAQIAVAQFTNSAGLTKVGTTIYQESNNSGAANVRTMDDLGLSVTSSALEMSNVDIANEFAEMIITQRGFQANSKMTTVSDEMLETVVNMKR